LNNKPNVLETEEYNALCSEMHFLEKLIGHEVTEVLKGLVGQLFEKKQRKSLILTLNGFRILEDAGFRRSASGLLIPHNSEISIPRFDENGKLLGRCTRNAELTSFFAKMTQAAEEKHAQRCSKALAGGLDTPLNRRFHDACTSIYENTWAIQRHPAGYRTIKEQENHVALGRILLSLSKYYKITVEEFLRSLVRGELKGMISRCADPDLSVKYTLFDFDRIENRVSARYLRRFKAAKEAMANDYADLLIAANRLPFQASPEQIKHLAEYSLLIAEERRMLQLRARYVRLEMDKRILLNRHKPGFVMPRPLRIDVDLFGEPFVHNTGLNTIPFPVFAIGHYPSLAACQAYAESDLFYKRAHSASFVKNKAIFDTFETGRFEALTAPGA
jgi:hypothetical protein